MIRRTLTKRQGFTLMEVLIAAGLVGVVMAMAMQAFVGLSKVSNLTRSRLIASTEASKGVREIAALLRRAHVIYYTGRPISAAAKLDSVAERTARKADQVNAGYVGVVGTDPITDPIPPALTGAATALVPGNVVRYNFSDPGASPFANGQFKPYNRGLFRFWDWSGQNAAVPTNTLAGANRLKTNTQPDSGEAYDQFFSSPLLYIGEAHFNKDTDNDGVVGDMYQPVYWTFHVIYLAPMDIADDWNRNQIPAWCARGFYGPSTLPTERGAGGLPRSVIPFELRVLTVDGVDADKTPGGTVHRSLASGGDTEFQAAPFDYPSNTINYDPIPLAMRDGEALSMDPTQATPPTGKRQDLLQVSAAAIMPAGPRVNGAMHTNYGNIGNDPPNEAALRQTRETQAAFPELKGQANRDRVLAQYVDPDSVHGTCVRLLNTIGSSPNTQSSIETQHVVTQGLYRRYLNAYGGEYLYNHYRGLLNTASPDYVAWDWASGAPLPHRALISVATRYRNDSKIDFQFANDSVELDLENLVHFQSINRRSRQ